MYPASSLLWWPFGQQVVSVYCGKRGCYSWGCLQVFLFLSLTLWGVRWRFKLRFQEIGKGLCDLTYSPAEECDMFRQKKEPSVINFFNCLGVGVGGEGVVYFFFVHVIYGLKYCICMILFMFYMCDTVFCTVIIYGCSVPTHVKGVATNYFFIPLVCHQLQSQSSLPWWPILPTSPVCALCGQRALLISDAAFGCVCVCLILDSMAFHKTLFGCVIWLTFWGV